VVALVNKRAAEWTHSTACGNGAVRNSVARSFTKDVRAMLDEIDAECRASEPLSATVETIERLSIA